MLICLHDTSLPGFLMSRADSFRLEDDDQGRPQYQTLVSLRNDEATPGLVKLAYRWGTEACEGCPYEGKTTWDETTPMRVPATSSVDVGIVTETPLFELWTQPYLALNRNQQRLDLPKVDSEAMVRARPFVGSRESDWQPRHTGDIIVDDLDPGFTIWREQEQEVAQSGPGFLSEDIDMDQGLPEFQLRFGNVQYWARSVYWDSWGKYRRTHALIHPGRGKSHAALTATLPHAGQWRLSYYLGINTAGEGNVPSGALLRSYLGEYEMTLVSEAERRPIEFDGAQASFGWNDMGAFELPAGDVTLEVANVTSGTVVIVDAIRWRPGHDL